MLNLAPVMMSAFGTELLYESAVIFGWIELILYLVAYAIVGHDILRKAFRGICNGRVFDENFLMALATLGAIGLAVYENIRGNGTLDMSQPLDLNEAVAVMLFYQVGEWFQSVAVGKSRKNIAALMDIRPDYANVEQAGEIVQVDPAEVPVGSTIFVYPGEKIPMDGIVMEGNSTLNTSALTGESMPRDVAAGDEVISGCINMTGVLQVQTTKVFGQSTVSKILELVEEAGSRKSKSEQFISKFARVYTPAVTISAMALAILPPVVRMLMGDAAMWGDWIYRALTFLVISCPCALVISIPLTFFAGLGGAGKAGILIKGSNYVETLSKADVVVFDKTGTLTEGKFKVQGIFPVGQDAMASREAPETEENHRSDLDARERLLRYAAYAESTSSHPISKSLLQAYGKSISPDRVSDIQEISGHGVVATIRPVEEQETGKDEALVRVAVGNLKWMQKLGVSAEELPSAGTTVHVALDGVYAGYILVADAPKSTATEAIHRLKKMGVKRTVMLTGDAEAVAEKVATDLQIDEFFSELLPADKVAEVERLLGEMEKIPGSLIFVGDGINDAPVLTRADIGVAMGALGSDAAIEAADVVLMDDDPGKVATAIAIAKRIMGIVHQNIGFSLGVKFACLALGAFGVANMWFAIFADVGVMVLAVLNATRALRPTSNTGR